MGKRIVIALGGNALGKNLPEQLSLIHISLDPDMPMTVLSKDPKSTRLTYRVQAVHRANFPAWHRAMHHAKLYINGGGSLIQDVTSRRSLWYYLHNIQTAKRCGCKVQMYGCGIGPVIRESHRKMAARVLNANAVSYTHLDVYKRQTRTSRAFWTCWAQNWAPFCGKFSSNPV